MFVFRAFECGIERGSSWRSISLLLRLAMAFRDCNLSFGKVSLLERHFSLGCFDLVHRPTQAGPYQIDMSRVLKEHIDFFRQFRERFQTTGSVAPSSRFLANAMAGPLRKHVGAKRILEVGPGTGAVTQRIVPLLNQNDRFDLVEINGVFAEMIEARFETDPRFQPVANVSQVHVCPLQEFQTAEQYDFIVSGLPINNFSSGLVAELFESFFRLLKPDGVLSYFEYMYVRPARRLVAPAKESRRLKKLDEIVNDYCSRFRFRRSWVFVNFPPAWVQHLRNTNGGAAETNEKSVIAESRR